MIRTVQAPWLVISLLVGGGVGLLTDCRAPVSHMQVNEGEACSSCHQSEFQSAQQPLHVGIISQECEQCHSNTQWAPARGSDHSFLLDGAHADTPCNDCHTGLPPRYEGTPETCMGCHESERDAVESPSHEDFDTECLNCHTTEAWTPATIEHEWALLGAHAEASCGDCHQGDPPQYEGTPTDCADCHQAERDEVSEPSHEGFSQDCSSCHSAEAWRPAEFPEHEWPLEGAHAQTVCGDCHQGDPPQYEGVPTDCVGCHEEDLRDVVEPSHDGFSDDCSSCHTTISWEGADFEHTADFPLDGAHATTECGDCHTGNPPQYEGLASDCVSCHAGDRNAVTDPPHEGFSDDCSSCHSTTSWDSADFEHTTAFVLQGGHQGPDCGDCHTGSPAVFSGLSSDCVSCHADDRNTATNPPHEGFADDCSTCHGIESWDSADFEHTTAFVLQGGHQGPDCGDCHTGSPAVFSGLSSDCVSCHQQDFQGSTFPGHDAFPTTCQDCHTIQGWTPATGGHPENRFPTRGDHNFQCNECHNPALGPNGAGNTDCVGCHVGEHTLARMDREHQGEVRNYPTGNNRAPNFCLDCHPRGRE